MRITNKMIDVINKNIDKKVHIYISMDDTDINGNISWFDKGIICINTKYTEIYIATEHISEIFFTD